MKKRIFALYLALSLMFSLCVSASAVGTITIDNAAEGNLYEVYKVFDAEVSPVNPDAVRYKLPEGMSSFSENDYFEIDDDGYVTAKAGAAGNDGKLLPNAITFLKGLIANTMPVKSMEANNSTITFEVDDYGYYYITSGLGTAVSVTTNNENVTIHDKNDNLPSWHPEDPNDPDNPSKGKGKTILTGTGNVETADFKVGDTITFQMKIDTANFNGERIISSYLINDKMPAGLQFTGITKVEVKDQTGTTAKTAPTVAYTKIGDINGFPIKVMWVDQTNNNASIYANRDQLIVTYTAKLLDTTVIDDTGNINTGEFNVRYVDPEKPDGDDPNVPETPDNPSTPGGNPDPNKGTKQTDTATVYSYAIAIKKVDAATGGALKGVEFEFPFVVKTSATKSNEYTYNGTGTTKLTTDADGIIVVRGLDRKSYSVTETKTLSGYNLPKEPIVVQATQDGKSTTSVTKYIDANGALTDTKTDVSVSYTNSDLSASVFVVLNKSGAILPSTGGEGTVALIAIGAFVFLGTALILITKKRLYNRGM